MNASPPANKITGPIAGGGGLSHMGMPLPIRIGRFCGWLTC